MSNKKWLIPCIFLFKLFNGIVIYIVTIFTDITFQCDYEGTMTQLFDVGTEEFSVILLWSYGAAAIALTLWSTFLLWSLS